MKLDAMSDKVYAISEEIVDREIEGEIIIVPLISGIGDLEDDIFTLNQTARSIWNKLDGIKKIKEIIEEVSFEYEVAYNELNEDIIGLIDELSKRKLIVEVTQS